MPERPPVVAIINTSPDIVDMLRIAVQRAGVVAVTAMTHEIRDGEVNIEDVAPPYEDNWRLFLHVKEMPVMKGRFFVLTSTNVRHVERLAGPDQQIYEVIGKPVDIDQIVQATREALNARPTRH